MNMKKQTTQFKIKSQKEFEDKVKTFSKEHPGVHVADTVFDTVFVTTRESVSQFTKAEVEFKRGFFQDGKFHEFTKEFVDRKTKTTVKKGFRVFSGG